MPIIETKQYSRPNTNTPFFSDVAPTLPGYISSRDAVAPFVTSGALVINRAVSDDQLTQISTLTYNNLETYSAVDSLFSIHMDSEYYSYAQQYNIPNGVYQQTGIDQPFTCTVTYSFAENGVINTEGHPISEFLSSGISRNSNNTLQNIDVHSDHVVAVFKFNNSLDFTNNHYQDLFISTTMFNSGITRSFVYALV